MSWPWTVWPIVTSLVIRGCLRRGRSNSSLRPPGPAYFLKTLRPAAAWAVARWVTVWPSISFGDSVTPSRGELRGLLAAEDRLDVHRALRAGLGRGQVELTAVDPEVHELAQRSSLDVADVDVELRRRSGYRSRRGTSMVASVEMPATIVALRNTNPSLSPTG